MGVSSVVASLSDPIPSTSSFVSPFWESLSVLGVVVLVLVVILVLVSVIVEEASTAVALFSACDSSDTSVAIVSSEGAVSSSPLLAVDVTLSFSFIAVAVAVAIVVIVLVSFVGPFSNTNSRTAVASLGDRRFRRAVRFMGMDRADVVAPSDGSSLEERCCCCCCCCSFSESRISETFFPISDAVRSISSSTISVSDSVSVSKFVV